KIALRQPTRKRCVISAGARGSLPAVAQLAPRPIQQRFRKQSLSGYASGYESAQTPSDGSAKSDCSSPARLPHQGRSMVGSDRNAQEQDVTSGISVGEEALRALAVFSPPQTSRGTETVRRT